MLQLKYPTDFFSSDCLTFSLSKPKKKKKKRYYDTEKGRREKKKNLRSSGESYCQPSPSPARLRKPIDTVIQRKGRRKKKGLAIQWRIVRSNVRPRGIEIRR